MDKRESLSLRNPCIANGSLILCLRNCFIEASSGPRSMA
ncbi:hypothetical protein SynRS9902_01926 [Synechococcus sp. RS9902]|nr:hypothetical protein SynRS9902_01926 [Synechococcus sp. RS9902]